MGKPRRVIRFMNDQVIAVDIFGEAIREFYGPYDDVRDAVLEASNEKTKFQRQTLEGPPGVFEDVEAESW